MARLAAGRRSVADDPAAAAIARRLEAASRGAAVGERNLAAGADLVGTAEASLQSAHDVVARQRELSVQARNGTLSAEDRATIQQEYDQLSEQLAQTAAGADFAGTPLLDGNGGAGRSVEFTDGGGDAVRVDLPDLQAVAADTAGRNVADPATATALDDAAARIGQARGRLGAAVNRLAHQQEAVAAGRVATEAARSRLEDTDIAEAMATMARERVRQGLQLAGVRLTGESSRRVLDILG
jgi:flagellin